jgi:Flp pilus assembly protein TadG
MRALRAIRFKNRNHRRNGMTSVEFALISPVLFLTIIGSLESSMVMFAEHLLEGASFNASRLGKTGYVVTGETQEQTIKDLLAARIDPILDPTKLTLTSQSYKDYSSINQPEPYIDANGNGMRDNGENFTDVNGNGVWDADQGKNGYGQAQEVVVYTVTYPWKLFTPVLQQLMGNEKGEINLQSRIVVRNEPYAF